MSTETVPIEHVQTALEKATAYTIKSEQTIAAAVVATMQQPELYPGVIAAATHHHQALKNIRDGLRLAVAVGQAAGKVPVLNAVPFINLLPSFVEGLSFLSNLLGHFTPEQSAAAPSLDK